jgi:hypothetical protein
VSEDVVTASSARELKTKAFDEVNEFSEADVLKGALG